MGDSAYPDLDTMLTGIRQLVERPASNLQSSLVYNARRRRDQLFGEHRLLFGEPAWDILLDLHAQAVMDRRVCVSAACIAAAVPATTGLRHIAALEAAGLIRRITDPQDRRRSWLTLSQAGNDKMERWLAATD